MKTLENSNRQEEKQDCGDRGAAGQRDRKLSLKARLNGGVPIQKRRSQKQQSGREWICAYCLKSYFQSNSLVFHVRQKHLVEPTSQRYIKALLSRAGRRNKVSDTLEDLASEQKHTKTPLLDQPHAKGGPVTPLHQFEDIVSCLLREGILEKIDDEMAGLRHPIAQRIADLQEAQEEGLLGNMTKRPTSAGQQDCKIGITDCDTALATYLVHVAAHMKAHYYRVAVKTILMFHDWIRVLNDFNDKQEDHVQDSLKKRKKSHLEQQRPQDLKMDSIPLMPSSINSSEEIPTACNEFIVCYCGPRSHSQAIPKRSDLIDVADHLIDWLFQTHQTSFRALR